MFTLLLIDVFFLIDLRDGAQFCRVRTFVKFYSKYLEVSVLFDSHAAK